MAAMQKGLQRQQSHLKGESAVLCLSLSALQCILCPHPVAVHKLGLPGLDVAVQVGNQLILIMGHARPVAIFSCVSRRFVEDVNQCNIEMAGHMYSKLFACCFCKQVCTSKTPEESVGLNKPIV